MENHPISERVWRVGQNLKYTHAPIRAALVSLLQEPRWLTSLRQWTKDSHWQPSGGRNLRYVGKTMTSKGDVCPVY